MHFDLEIYFSGLCFFTFEGDNPCEPKKCTVLLVDATREYPYADQLGSRAPAIHRPRMSIPAKNFIVGRDDVFGFPTRPGSTPPAGFPQSVSAAGEDLVDIDLSGVRVELGPSCGFPEGVYVPRQRKRGKFSRPDGPGGRTDWFDWIAILRDIEDDLDRLKAYDCQSSGLEGQSGCHQCHAPVISCVTFSSGELESFQLGRQRGQNLVFEFRTVCGEKPVGDENGPKHGRLARCLADRLVLRFRRLRQPLEVILHKGEEVRRFGIGASRPESANRVPVAASITNLDATNHLSPRAIYDFLWYYELFHWKAGKEKEVFDRIIPWAPVARHSGKTPSTGNCPPAGG